MTEYQEQSISIRGSTSNGTSLRIRKICFCFFLEDNSKNLIYDLNNINYFSNSSYNLVSFTYLNNHVIYYENKNKMLYQFKTRRILAQAKR